MASSALLLALACVLAQPVACYVAPQHGAVAGRSSSPALGHSAAHTEVPEEDADGLVGVAAISASVGALLGWLHTRRQQAAAGAAATAVAMSPIAATAMVEYSNVQYLGGTDQVDINNANVQAYRQFPGMYPTAAGQIATHGPYKDVADVYNIPGLKDDVKNIIKKYEKNLVCLPPSPAYFLDRINNGMYR
eukprot:CAMPEP_0170622484 /NCGR_PEP_ID=MMETSP0224-20130122/29157_1 /TAXON_ID=285029 /ORGANISM="Togula jolla, Strain CCCM 725" /LENGTH=190 /DNA_ID=CAMNT_0010948809 /DNA_START=63 /DNA_END=635 /DNA_ORIENTATION=-